MNPKRSRRLVEFDDSYYKYPNNLGVGYFGTYPIDRNLSEIEIELRTGWIRNAVQWASHPTTMALVDALGSDSVDLREIVVGSVSVHGLFYRRFAERQIVRSLRKLIRTEIDPILIDWDRYAGVMGIQSADIDIVSDLLVDVGFAMADLDNGLSRNIAEWFDRNSKPHECVQCGAEFRPIDIPYWVYYGSDGTRECCFRCPMENPIKADIPEIVHEFVESAGFIPRSDCSPIEQTFMSRVDTIDRPAAISAWCRMGGMEWIKSKFTSWFHALDASDVLPGGVLRTGRGLRCLARDGHECLSLEEQKIDDWLNDRGIHHEKEPNYPLHPKLNPTGKKRADWKCGDIYIEYFGLAGDSGYDNRTLDKFNMCRDLGIQLIGIYPDDLAALELKLAQVLTLFAPE